MKRLATCLLWAVMSSNLPARAADPLPPPTGMAPTTPQVPMPTIVDGLPVVEGSDWSRTSFRDRLGLSAGPTMSGTAVSSGPRVWNRMTSWVPFGKKTIVSEPHDTWGGKPKWCENCAPAVRYPLPALPEGMSTSRQVAPASFTTGADVVARNGNGNYGGSCPNGSCSGNGPPMTCCQKLKAWLCYKQTPIHLPLIAAPKQPSIPSYFPTYERPGKYGWGGYAPNACAANNVPMKDGMAAGKFSFPNRSATGGGTPCPAPAEAIMPGYRLASPGEAAPAGAVVKPAGANVVNWSSAK